MSRFDVQHVGLVCLNGPKEGVWIDAPADIKEGFACAAPWLTVNGAKRYAVYVVVIMPGDDERKALMYLGASYDTAGRAQAKVQELSMVAHVLHASGNSGPSSLN